ncbi:MAG: iron uptake system protein EfeO [Pseudonocardiaceae bacterium]
MRRLACLIAVTGLVLIPACSANQGPSTSTQDASPTAAAAPSPQVQQAIATYQTYVEGQIDEMVTRTTVLTDAVRAGDLAAAQAAYAPSRVPWEKIEPIAGLVEEIDGKVDARVDDFAGVDDPTFTGWHRLEYLLFARETTEGAAPFADQLDADLRTLKTQFATLELPPVEVAVGASELIEEVSLGKITGEEDRYAKTDLWDFNGNLEGSKAVVEVLTPALQATDPALLADINKGFAELDATLAPLRSGDGWVLYCLKDDQFPSPRCPAVTVPPERVDTLKAQLAGLSEKTSQIAGALGFG